MLLILWGGGGGRGRQNLKYDYIFIVFFQILKNFSIYKFLKKLDRILAPPSGRRPGAVAPPCPPLATPLIVTFVDNNYNTVDCCGWKIGLQHDCNMMFNVTYYYIHYYYYQIRILYKLLKLKEKVRGHGLPGLDYLTIITNHNKMYARRTRSFFQSKNVI